MRLKTDLTQLLSLTDKQTKSLGEKWLARGRSGRFRRELSRFPDRSVLPTRAHQKGVGAKRLLGKAHLKIKVHTARYVFGNRMASFQGDHKPLPKAQGQQKTWASRASTHVTADPPPPRDTPALPPQTPPLPTAFPPATRGRGSRITSLPALFHLAVPSNVQLRHLPAPREAGTATAGRDEVARAVPAGNGVGPGAESAGGGGARTERDRADPSALSSECLLSGSPSEAAGGKRWFLRSVFPRAEVLSPSP